MKRAIKYNDLRWRRNATELICSNPDAYIKWRPKLKMWDVFIFFDAYPAAKRYATAKKLRTDTLLDACAFVLRQTVWARICHSPDSVSFLDLARSIRDENAT